MNIVTKKQYLENPCRTASSPYWKAVCISIPDNMKIVHDREFNTELLKRYIDEPYFRLRHCMLEVKPVSLPEGYSLYEASISDFVDHINSCYEDIGITVSEMQNYLTREQYNSDLWLAVKEDCKGRIVATGIAELDREIDEVYWNGFRYQKSIADVDWGVILFWNCCGERKRQRDLLQYQEDVKIPIIQKHYIENVAFAEMMCGTS